MSRSKIIKNKRHQVKRQSKSLFASLITFFLFVPVVFCVLSFGNLIIPVAQAATGINRTINFQGKVVNKTDGTNISDSTYTFVFAIYNASSGGTKLWGDETQSGVSVTSGIFQVALGSVRSFATDSLDFNQDNLWLQVTFNGEAFGSRIRLASVPYAVTAEKVSGLTVTQTTGTLTIANGKTLTANSSATIAGTDGKTLTLNGSTTLADNVITFGGTETLTLTAAKNVSFADAFTTSGANALTLTTTGTTNVTLPTTGTLLTNTASAVQTVTSTQTSGTILGISDSTAETAALVGQSITLSGTGAFDQTGLQFNLSGASGSNLNDIVGSGSTWKVSRAGALTVASCTGCGGGGSTTLNNVLAANGTATIANVDNAIIWNWAPSTAGRTDFTFGATTAPASGTNTALSVALSHTSNTMTNGLLVSISGASGTTTNGIQISQSAGTLTNGLLFNGTIGTDINTSAGRTLNIAAGTAASGTSGNINITAGTNSGSSGAGGNIVITAGAGTNSGVGNSGGNITIEGGTSTLSSVGNITIGGNANNTGSLTIGNSLATVGITAVNWSVTTGGALTVASCSGCGGSAGGLVQVPTSNTAGAANANVVAPTAASIIGMTIRTSTNATTADALDLVTAHTSGTATNALLINQNAAGTTTNGIQITQTSGKITNGININGISGAASQTGITIGAGWTTGLAISQNATGQAITVTATAVPTADMVAITNNGQGITSAGVSGLQITYVGGSAAVEASAERIDLTPGGTVGGVWNGLRIVKSSAAASGVAAYGIKLEDNNADVLNGIDRGIDISGGGWDSAIIIHEGQFSTPYGGNGLIENLATFSEDFNNAAWVKTANTTVSSNNSTQSPNGETTGDTIQFAANAATDDISQTSAVAAASGTYAASVWLRSVSGTATVRLGLRGTGGTIETANQSITATTNWRRYSFAKTFTGSATGNAEMFIDDGASSSQVQVIAWGGQIEKLGASTDAAPGPYAMTNATRVNSGGTKLVGVSLNGAINITSPDKPSAATGATAIAPLTLLGGAGGPSTGASQTGGVGGLVSLTTGAGGAASGGTASTGGAGGAVTFTAGVGGASTGSGTGTGGAGGGLTFTAGNGGLSSGGSSNTGGAGGAISITAGNAGAAGNANGGTITINSGTANGTGTSTINIGSAGVTALNFGTAGVAKTINIGQTGSGTGADTINIGNSGVAKTIAIGTTTAGTADTINIANTQTGGSVNIGTAMTSGSISIAGGSAVMTGNITIGSTGQTSGVTKIIGGTGTGALGGTTSGIDIIPGVAGTINIGASGGAGTGTITLGKSTATNTVAIGDGASGATTVNIGNSSTGAIINIGNTSTTGAISVGGGSAVRTANITIGSTGQTSGVTKIIGGTGVGTFGGSTSGIDIIPGVAGTINIGASGGAGTGAITIGQSTATQIINIANGVTAAGNTKTVNIGTAQNASTGVTAINIGLNNSSTGVNTVTIKAGGSGGSAGPSVTLGGTASTTGVCSSLALNTAPVAGTAYELRDCSGTPALDYAEMYPVEETADYGDVMVMGTKIVEVFTDDGKGNILKDAPKIKTTQLVKASKPYDSMVIGVLSNNYSDFTSTGYDVIEPQDNPKPVALNGRILVKVATNSESIRPGDYLTTSDQPGRAMKALHSGQVIGKAMQSWDKGSGVDQVLLFVEQGYYNGLSQSNIAASLTGDVSFAQFIANTADTHFGLSVTNDGQLIIRAADGSDAIRFDRNGNAYFKGIITADKIQANQIVGLDNFADKIALLDASVASLSAQVSSVSASQTADLLAHADLVLGISTNSRSLSLSDLSVGGLATVSGDLRVKGSGLFEGIVSVIDTLTAHDMIIHGLATYLGQVVFTGDVTFNNTPVFSSDTAGVAVIKKDTDMITVSFEKEYKSTPIVTASLTDEKSATDSAVIDTKFIITERSTKGFVIKLTSPVAEDTEFSWIAVDREVSSKNQ